MDLIHSQSRVLEIGKKVNDGKACAFLTHVGKGPDSAHNYSVRCYEDLKTSMAHIDKVLEKQNKKVVFRCKIEA